MAPRLLRVRPPRLPPLRPLWWLGQHPPRALHLLQDLLELDLARADAIGSAVRRLAGGAPAGDVLELLRFQLARLTPAGGVTFPVRPGPALTLDWPEARPGSRARASRRR